MTKYLIFDSGPIINMAQNCLLSLFRDLETIFQGEFIVTPAVRYETIEHPIKIKKFGWSAIRTQALLDDEILRPYEEEDIVSNEELRIKTQILMEKANHSFLADGKPIHLIDKGEAECLALANILNARKIPNAVIIDERTARMLCEDPEKLKELMESKLHTKLTMDLENLKEFQNIKVLRSTEMVYLAFKRKLIGVDKKKLETILYALKFGGCSVSEKEIEFLKK